MPSHPNFPSLDIDSIIDAEALASIHLSGDNVVGEHVGFSVFAENPELDDKIHPVLAAHTACVSDLNGLYAFSSGPDNAVVLVTDVTGTGKPATVDSILEAIGDAGKGFPVFCDVSFGGTLAPLFSSEPFPSSGNYSDPRDSFILKAYAD